MSTPIPLASVACREEYHMYGLFLSILKLIYFSDLWEMNGSTHLVNKYFLKHLRVMYISYVITY